ncbi:lycopene cyclase domain-containing protein [uncultured Ilyobacter sp.]|uniref:lycopene cyclase domain-containing protein n=1 Tax=uncultured Ilyobacter sp. TaxID=544433 RepID=UPI0029C66E5C|nr:lycopene cyclase domain-containing protein [uncultured Ilyobacter sp.]
MKILEYNFLILSLIFIIPGALIFVLRKDLRIVIKKMSLIALPFAYAERLFYPIYWKPNFLFDLGNKIGFGLEDFIFVVGLASFSSTAYVFASGKRYVKNHIETSNSFFKKVFIISIFIVTLIELSIWMSIPIIYSSFFIMIMIPGWIVFKNPNFLVPGMLGGVLSAVIYFILCLIFNSIYTDIFRKIWHTQLFLNKFAMGVPLEELIYGFGAGFSATIIYPYIFNYKFGS